VECEIGGRERYIMPVERIEQKGNSVSLFGSAQAILAGFYERDIECLVTQRTAQFLI